MRWVGSRVVSTFLVVGLLFASFAQAQEHPLLSGGPMLAYSEMTEVAIWVQTHRAADVQLRYRDLEGGEEAASPVVRASDARDNIALIKLTGLPMGRKFAYRLFIDGQEIKRDYPLEFQTQPHWRWAKRPAEPPTFSFGLGSCLYINDTPFDRPGDPYGGDFETLTALHRDRPDFMLWLGDNTYYREMDWLTESAMRYRWRKDRQFPLLQPLLGSTHNYAIWDDHDYGPNDSDRSFRLRDTALKVFEDYFPSVVRGTAETRGCFFRFEWADVEFFMLDDRYHRAPNAMPDGPKKVMFGPEQMQWLKDSLLNSRASFKVIASGGQMINPMTFFEAFGNVATEQKDLFDFIATNRIDGVVFLSGDRHASELLKVQWPGSPYPWYEFTSSPLSAGSGRNDREENNPARVPGTWVTRTRSYGLITVSGPFQSRVLRMTAKDKTGATLWTHEVSQEELRRPRPSPGG